LHRWEDPVPLLRRRPMLERANDLPPNAPNGAAPDAVSEQDVSMRDVVAAAGELVDAVNEVQGAVKELQVAGRSFVQRQANERPYVLLGVAAGIGFVVGGGLASRTSLGFLALGGRLVAARILKRALAATVSANVDDSDANVQSPSG